jgi:cell division control protein 6
MSDEPIADDEGIVEDSETGCEMVQVNVEDETKPPATETEDGWHECDLREVLPNAITEGSGWHSIDTAAIGSTVTSTVTFQDSRIFRDKDLFEVDYVPDSILHRDSQIKGILADTIRPYNIVGVGGFGTGKTATVRRICQDLPPGYNLVYVSCSRANTQTRVLSAMLADLATPQSWLPLDKYRELVEIELKRYRYVILVLDEVDQMLRHRDSEADAFFYILSRDDKWKNVVAILLSNRADIEPLLKRHLDPRTRDTFRWKRVDFTEYDALELGNIGEDRMKKGLRDTAWDKGTAAQIARISLFRDLGARGVIDITRWAGLKAEREQHDKITEEDIREAASVDPGIKLIQSFTPIIKALTRAISCEQPIQTSRLHTEYFQKIAETYDAPQDLDAMEGYIQKLVTFGIVTRQQSGRGRGRGSETWLSIAPEMLSTVKKSLQEPDEKSLEGIDPTAAPVSPRGPTQ